MKINIIITYALFQLGYCLAISQQPSSLVLSSSFTGKYIVVDHINENEINLVELESGSKLLSLPNSYLPLSWIEDSQAIFWHLQEKEVEIVEYDIKNNSLTKISTFSRIFYDKHLDFADHISFPLSISKISELFIVYAEKGIFYKYSPLQDRLEQLFGVSDLVFKELASSQLQRITINNISLSNSSKEIIVSFVGGNIGYLYEINLETKRPKFLHSEIETINDGSYIYSTKTDGLYIFFRYITTDPDVSTQVVLLDSRANTCRIILELEECLLLSLIDIPYRQKYFINVMALSHQELGITENILSDLAQKLKINLSVREVDYLYN